MHENEKLVRAYFAAVHAKCKRRSNNPSLKRPDNLVAPE